MRQYNQCVMNASPCVLEPVRFFLSRRRTGEAILSCRLHLAAMVVPLIVTMAVCVSGAMPIAYAAEGDFQPVPKLTQRLTDTTATLSATDAARIETRLKEYEARKGAQIAVLIVGTTQPETIFDYSTRVMTEWKLGRKNIDDGVLFVIAKNDRKTQILVGLGLSGSLTDAMSKRILTESVAPKFRAGDFAGGIDDGVAKIVSVTDGEALPSPPPKRVGSHATGGYANFMMLAIFAAIVVGPLLRSLLGRFLGAGATGGIAAAVAWFVAGGLFLPALAGVVMFIAVLLMGAMNFANGRGGGWGGGGFGGGGGSGSGGGGFSGGGGGFDGGGASGDW